MFSDYIGDSSGESLGDGLDASALDLSGSGSSALDDLSGVGEDPLQGSTLSLDGLDAPSVTDPLTDLQSASLSGVSDPIASTEWDTFSTDTNGAGSAGSTHPLDVSSPENVAGLFSAVSKFGANLGQLFLSAPASAAPRVAGRPSNLNPNKSFSSALTGGHAALLVGLVIVVGAAIAFGGQN